MLTNVNHILGPLNMYIPCCGKQNFIQSATIRSEWTPDHQLHKCPPVVAINGNENRKTWWKHDGNIMEHLTPLTENDGGNTMETPVRAPSAPRQGWPPRDVATSGAKGVFRTFSGWKCLKTPWKNGKPRGNSVETPWKPDLNRRIDFEDAENIFLKSLQETLLHAVSESRGVSVSGADTLRRSC